MSPTEPFRLWSTAFEDGGTIPVRHTCEGEELSPPLLWTTVPSDTRSVAILCEDPDAPRGTFVHWVLWNLPADATELAEGVPQKPELPSGTRQGVNDAGTIGWTGPCPPRGPAHRYVFTCLALGTMVGLDPSSTIGDLRAAVADDVLAEASLIGRFGR